MGKFLVKFVDMKRIGFGLLLLLVTIGAMAQEFPVLTAERAGELADLALHCIHREYPNKTGHVMNDSSELWSPMEMHPAFYGCFDWHSSVHGHWMLIRLLKTVPDLPNNQQIREALDQNLQRENILQEVRYFEQEGRKSFERTYGWAWLLKLAEELETWEDEQGLVWKDNLQALTDKMVELYMDFLPKQDFPIRTGVHPNTAFGLAFALDYCDARANPEDSIILSFKELLNQRALFYYGEDRDAPFEWEPGGEDFFSPALMEADLMTRILNQEDYTQWIDRYFSDLDKLRESRILQPVVIQDKTDGKLVHLDGVNLSRSWCMKRISSYLPKDHPLGELFRKSAIQHANHALENIISGNYAGEHWLASFAVYLLSN
jgi:hypothetical protein